MNRNIIVSIIIPVYNTEQYIKQCLDSVKNQTFKDFECICINDCSTDNSYTILKEYAQKDDRFTIINLSENNGQGKVRNEGIKNSKGKYIIFVDSDDWISNDYVEILYKAIEKNNVDFVSSNFYLFDNSNHTIRKNTVNSKIYYDKIICEENEKNVFLKNFRCIQVCTVWSNIFKKEFILCNNIFFNTLLKREDSLFMWEAIIKAHNFLFIKDCFYYYRTKVSKSIMSLLTIEDTMKYYNQLKLINRTKFKKYLPYCYTYISLSIIRKFEELPLNKSNIIFSKFKELIYDKDFNIDYSCASFRNKIRLFFFKFCLKYNLNYCFLAKIHRNFNPIRLIKK